MADLVVTAAAARPRTPSWTAPRTPVTDGPDVLPALPSDLYGYAEVLATQDQQVLGRLGDWLAREVAPIANDQWARAEFPHHLIPSLGDLGVIGLGDDRPGHPAASGWHPAASGCLRLHTDAGRRRWRCAFVARRRR